MTTTKHKTLITISLALILALPLSWVGPATTTVAGARPPGSGVLGQDGPDGQESHGPAVAGGGGGGGPWDGTGGQRGRPAAGDSIGSLAQSFKFTLRGDVVSAGVGLRGTGAGNITVSGIPAGATVYRALLYWATIGTDNTFTSVTFSGGGVNGALIGTAGDTCWGAQHNFTYRADVTGIVNGNGTYFIGGLPHGSPSTNDSQGASLVVIYANPSAPQKTITVNDGAVSLIANDAYTDTLWGFDPLPPGPGSQAKVTYIVGDGQAASADGNLVFRGSVIGSNVFVGGDGNYWDDLSFDVSPLATASVLTTTVNSGDDCLLWVDTVFSVTSYYKVDLPIIRK